jgi:hypothetical protein
VRIPFSILISKINLQKPFKISGRTDTIGDLTQDYHPVRLWQRHPRVTCFSNTQYFSSKLIINKGNISKQKKVDTIPTLLLWRPDRNDIHHRSRSSRFFLGDNPLVKVSQVKHFKGIMIPNLPRLFRQPITILIRQR